MIASDQERERARVCECEGALDKARRGGRRLCADLEAERMRLTRFEGLNLRLLLFSLCVDERGLRLQRHGEGADDARSADVAEDSRVGSRRYQVLDVQVSRH